MSTLIVLLLILVIVFLFYLIIRRKIPQTYPYFKNPYFISYAERKFYKVLEQIVSSNYYVFTQVSLGSLLKVDKSGKEYWEYMNKISRKSVDFVIADKTNFDALIVIELDDRSHSLYKRQDRDRFLKEALESANIQLIRFTVKNTYNTVDIQNVLLPYLNNR